MQLTDTAKKIIKMKYSLNQKETWEEVCLRVAEHVVSAEDGFKTTLEEKEKLKNKFFSMIYNQQFIPGGRILANAGTDIKNLMNCFSLPIEDSRSGIYQALKDAAEIFAWGGGCGYNFSHVREEGAEIKTTGGKASGPLSFLTLFDQTGEVIQQASRRGAQIGLLSVEHPDIERFIDFKAEPNSRNKRLLEEYHRNLKLVNSTLKNTKYYDVLKRTLLEDQLTHFNLSVVLTDEFFHCEQEDLDWVFNSVTDKTKEHHRISAKKLLEKISKQAWDSGDPGLFLIDRINLDNLVPYIGKIEVCNPCVVGSTLIDTTKGKIAISELVDKEVDVYCQKEDGTLTISKAFNIRKTRKNASLVKIKTKRSELICTPEHLILTKNRGWIQAQHLIKGDKPLTLIRQMFNETYVGIFLNNKIDKKKRENRFVASYYYDIENRDVHHIDGNTLNNSIENLEVLTHSEHSVLSNLGHENWSEIDKKGRYKKKEAKKQQKSIVLGEHKLGLNSIVDSVEYLDYTEDVYDMEVENQHNFIANGLVIHNCGEVPLLPYESCCLGSINLVAFYDNDTHVFDWELLEHTIRNAVRFLDNVQEISETPVEQINKMSKGLRRLGIGVMGWADLLAMMNTPYNSENAYKLAEYMSWFVSVFAWLESIELAKIRGAFEFYDKEKVNFAAVENILNSKFNPSKFNIDAIKEVGVRNVSVTSIAPTGSIALLCGVNSAIEPFFALSYRRNITEGVGNIATDFIIEINPILLDKVKEFGFEDKIEKIKAHIQKTGTIQDLDFLPESLRFSFLTSRDLHWSEHIYMQQAWQNYVTNAVSKTINMPNDATVEDVYKAFVTAWRCDLKGITIYRDGSRQFQILNVG